MIIVLRAKCHATNKSLLTLLIIATSRITALGLDPRSVWQTDQISLYHMHWIIAVSWEIPGHQQ